MFLKLEAKLGPSPDSHAPSPFLYDTVTLVFALISSFAIVFLFILISSDWFPYYAVALSFVLRLTAESYEMTNLNLINGVG